MVDQAWLSLKAAIAQITRSHDLPDLKPSEAFQRSVTALHSALVAGVVTARAATVNWYRRDRVGGSYLEDTETGYPIPPSIWGLPVTGTLMEWSIGSLSATLPANRTIRLGGIEIDRASLDQHTPQSASADSASGPSTTKATGRPAAKWWADFAMELALAVYEDGIPDFQEEMIDRVFQRMQERGVGEGSRTSVQPVISSLFEKAGK